MDDECVMKKTFLEIPRVGKSFAILYSRSNDGRNVLPTSQIKSRQFDRPRSALDALSIIADGGHTTLPAIAKQEGFFRTLTRGKVDFITWAGWPEARTQLPHTS